MVRQYITTEMRAHTSRMQIAIISSPLHRYSRIVRGTADIRNVRETSLNPLGVSSMNGLCSLWMEAMMSWITFTVTNMARNATAISRVPEISEMSDPPHLIRSENNERMSGDEKDNAPNAMTATVRARNAISPIIITTDAYLHTFFRVWRSPLMDTGMQSWGIMITVKWWPEITSSEVK